MSNCVPRIRTFSDKTAEPLARGVQMTCQFPAAAHHNKHAVLNHLLKVVLDNSSRISSDTGPLPVVHRTLPDQTTSAAVKLSAGLLKKHSLVYERNQSISLISMCQNSSQLTSLLMGDSLGAQESTSESWRTVPALVAPPHEEERSDDSDDDDQQLDSGFGSGTPPVSLGYYKPLSRCVDDLDKLRVTTEELDVSCFYWGEMDSDTSRRLLRWTPVGTFLVRASSDPRFLYSLSVKTERGATSVRILYDNGLFQFDCDRSIREQLPRFESVLALVDFYVLLSQEGGNKMWRWEEVSGDKHMKMTLLQPMRSSVPSLAHQARVKVNQCLENVFFPHLSVDKLKLSSKAKEFLRAYPYRS